VQCTWNSWKKLVVPCDDVSTILLGDFNAHVGNDAGEWKGVIGRHGDGEANDNGRILLQLCCSNTLCIVDTSFQDRDVHKYYWSLGQQSLSGFCIVSADLFPKPTRACTRGGENQVCRGPNAARVNI